jgi:hypothetical protein
VKGQFVSRLLAGKMASLQFIKQISSTHQIPLPHPTQVSLSVDQIRGHLHYDEETPFWMARHWQMLQEDDLDDPMLCSDSYGDVFVDNLALLAWLSLIVLFKLPVKFPHKRPESLACQMVRSASAFLRC